MNVPLIVHVSLFDWLMNLILPLETITIGAQYFPFGSIAISFRLIVIYFGVIIRNGWRPLKTWSRAGVEQTCQGNNKTDNSNTASSLT